MARIRSIKPEFFTSLAIANLSERARLCFVGLWTYADDAGRCVDDPRLIKAAVFPLDEKITPKTVEGLIDELADAGRIVRYTVDHRRYFVVRNWREHQRINRPGPSKLPPPPDEPSPPPHGGLTEDSLNAHGAITEGSPPEQGAGSKEVEQGGGTGLPPSTDSSSTTPNDGPGGTPTTDIEQRRRRKRLIERAADQQTDHTRAAENPKAYRAAIVKRLAALWDSWPPELIATIGDSDLLIALAAQEERPRDRRPPGSGTCVFCAGTGTYRWGDGPHGHEPCPNGCSAEGASA